MPSCVAPVSLRSTYAPSPWVCWLGSSPFSGLTLHHALLKFSPTFGNGRGLHRTRCRTLVRWCLSPKRESLNVRAANEYVGHNSSSERPHILKNNYLHTAFWPYSWAFLEVRIQHIFYCSVEELASTILKCTIYSVSCYFFAKIVLFLCQNKVG